MVILACSALSMRKPNLQNMARSLFFSNNFSVLFDALHFPSLVGCRVVCGQQMILTQHTRLRRVATRGGTAQLATARMAATGVERSYHAVIVLTQH